MSPAVDRDRRHRREGVLMDPLLQYFKYDHLPEGSARHISMLFSCLAKDVVMELPSSAERTVALRKLLEGKDAAVRTAIFSKDSKDVA